MSDEGDFPVPGTILWAIDIDLEKAIFRKGSSSKAGVDFLRFIDLNLHDPSGRIEGDVADKLVVAPDRGISLYLKKMIPDGMVALDDALRKTIDKSRQVKVHWWTIEHGQTIPTGLLLKYDGVPPGHCTLTVDRTMTVRAFLELVALISFKPLGHEFYGSL